jgi:hypothetical protein
VLPVLWPPEVPWRPEAEPFAPGSSAAAATSRSARACRSAHAARGGLAGVSAREFHGAGMIGQSDCEALFGSEPILLTRTLYPVTRDRD